ncbi:unnamed protein product [Moneuplotes crassus]|uniref:Uncharacterized protein n=1 Tax=Euplotes crassus TaxID=5936 RepID=A0AAD1UDW9_EUPCR|nr:unnamed protein product [Moneuplotes crassus]
MMLCWLCSLGFVLFSAAFFLIFFVFSFNFSAFCQASDIIWENICSSWIESCLLRAGFFGLLADFFLLAFCLSFFFFRCSASTNALLTIWFTRISSLIDSCVLSGGLLGFLVLASCFFCFSFSALIQAFCMTHWSSASVMVSFFCRGALAGFLFFSAVEGLEYCFLLAKSLELLPYFFLASMILFSRSFLSSSCALGVCLRFGSFYCSIKLASVCPLCHTCHRRCADYSGRTHEASLFFNLRIMTDTGTFTTNVELSCLSRKNFWSCAVPFLIRGFSFEISMLDYQCFCI